MTLEGHHIYLVLCRDQKNGVAVESQCEQKKTQKRIKGSLFSTIVMRLCE